MALSLSYLQQQERLGGLIGHEIINNSVLSPASSGDQMSTPEYRPCRTRRLKRNLPCKSTKRMQFSPPPQYYRYGSFDLHPLRQLDDIEAEIDAEIEDSLRSISPGADARNELLLENEELRRKLSTSANQCGLLLAENAELITNLSSIQTELTQTIQDLRLDLSESVKQNHALEKMNLNINRGSGSCFMSLGVFAGISGVFGFILLVLLLIIIWQCIRMKRIPNVKSVSAESVLSIGKKSPELSVSISLEQAIRETAPQITSEPIHKWKSQRMTMESSDEHLFEGKNDALTTPQKQMTDSGTLC